MVVTLKWGVIKFCLRWKERKQGDFNLGKLIRRHNRAENQRWVGGKRLNDGYLELKIYKV